MPDPAKLLQQGRRLLEAAELLKQLPPDTRQRAQAWLAQWRAERTLEARIDRARAQAEELRAGTTSAEQSEAVAQFVGRAGRLRQALAIADGHSGRERLRRRRRVRTSTDELLGEMFDFLLQRGAVEPTQSGRR